MLKILWFYVHKNPEAEAKRSYAHALERDLVLRRMRVTPLSCCLFSEKTLTIEKTTFSVTSVLIKQKNFKSPLQAQNFKSPLQAQNFKRPLQAQNFKSPLQVQNFKSPKHAQNFKSPLAPTSSEFQKPSTSPEF